MIFVDNIHGSHLVGEVVRAEAGSQIFLLRNFNAQAVRV